MKRNTLSHNDVNRIPLRGLRGRSIALVLALGVGGCFSPDDEMADGGTEGGTQGETGDASSVGTSGPSTSASTSASTTAGTDTASTSAGTQTTGTVDDTGTDTGPVCTPGEALGCDGNDLVVCNDDGTGEELTPCALGCFEDEVRCYDVDPSNGLAEFLDGAEDEDAYNFTGSVVIDTDAGTVTEDEVDVPVASFVTGADPEITVFVVGGLVTGDVDVTGSNALAIVSHGDIQIGGHFSLSASNNTAGPGEWTTSDCVGGDASFGAQTISGCGGGGFGTAGGAGGSATNQGTEFGGDAGGTTGNVTLVPLRGGCNAGLYEGTARGRGGGAAQLVSRTEIVIEGILSANGSSYTGGGSGGGLLLEAPVVDISGNIVANGGAGAGGGFLPVQGEDGQTDDSPAEGGVGADTNAGDGGNGAAGSTAAQNGESIDQPNLVFGGHGGGGVGRIRINTFQDAATIGGIASPNPSTGDIAIR